jgi:hypothetical protein
VVLFIPSKYNLELLQRHSKQILIIAQIKNHQKSLVSIHLLFTLFSLLFFSSKEYHCLLEIFVKLVENKKV